MSGATEQGLNPADLRMPHVEPGMRVGLFGGSFDPPHAGHLLVAETALRRLRLDQLWWIVTPQNPLKTQRQSGDLARRIALCRAAARHPRIRVTAYEAACNIRYSADTIALARRRHPAVRFVWVMGGDNLRSFHRWARWREILASVPVAVIDRPGATLSLLSSRMAQAYRAARLDERDAALLPFLDPPAWTFLTGPRSAHSSTAIRHARGENAELS